MSGLIIQATEDALNNWKEDEDWLNSSLLSSFWGTLWSWIPGLQEWVRDLLKIAISVLVLILGGCALWALLKFSCIKAIRWCQPQAAPPRTEPQNQ